MPVPASRSRIRGGGDRRSRPACRAALLLAASGLAGCAPPPPRDVILIVVDTLRADHLGVYGYPRPTSPHLDEWSESGLVFETAFATSPWTLPTFASVLTGDFPAFHRAGMRANGAKRPRSALAASLPTLPEKLRGLGYATAAFVGNPWLRPEFGLDRGFAAFDYERRRRADGAVERTLSWLRGRPPGPFFVFLHLFDPHLPYDAPAAFHGRFGAACRDCHPAPRLHDLRARAPSLSPAERAHVAALYDEEVAFVDEQLGRFFQELGELGLWQGSLVLLTADHGEELFDHGGFEHGHSLFQELLRVPLVVWGPGVRRGREAGVVSLVDIAPTVLEAAGAAADRDRPGASLWPWLRRRAAARERMLFAGTMLYGGEQHAVIEWPYKLAVAVSGRRRLFDLTADPGEVIDLSPRRPQLTERLAGALAAHLAAGRAQGEARPAEVEEETLRELRALGYAE